MQSIREYLKNLEEIKDLLSYLPDIEDYNDTFYDDMNYLIDKQIDKFEMKLNNKELEERRRCKKIGRKK